MKDRHKIKRFTRVETSMAGKKTYSIIIEVNGVRFSGMVEEA